MQHKLLFKIILILIALIPLQSNAQSGYTMIDSCQEIQDSWDTTITRTIVVFTDSGNFTVQQEYIFLSNIWVNTFYSPYSSTFNYTISDSANNVVELYRLTNITGQWVYDQRILLGYDSLGRVNDSIVQYYSGNSWNDTLRYSWQKDSTGNFIFNESKIWNLGQWNNDQRHEWYYDNLLRDTLEIDYLGNLTQWIPSHELHHIYNSTDLLDKFEIGYSGGNPQNLSRTQYFYQSAGQDTLQITFNGNINQWDTISKIRRTFDAFGNVILETTLNYNGSVWLNGTRTTTSYDNLNRIIIQLFEQGDILGNWIPDSRDSIYYDTLGNINKSNFMWNGSNWECSDFDNYEYYSPLGYHRITGMLDPNTCTIAGYYSDEIITYDSMGNVVYQEYDGHAGSSYGYQSFVYDSSGFCYQSSGFGSTMGGLTGQNSCIHYRPLIALIENNNISVCVGDTIKLISHQQGGAYIYSYSWRFNNQALLNSTPTLVTTINMSGWYSMTVTDTAGNFYTDSVFVQIHPSPNLGNNSTVCIPNSIILNPGSFTTYQWIDGSSLPTFTINSSIPDTILCWVSVTDSTGCSNTDSISIYYTICQSVEEALNEKIKIYPNPVANQLVIELSGQEIIRSVSVISSLGKINKSDRNDSNKEQYIYLNTFDLSPGIYHVEVVTNKQIYFARFVKE